MILDNPFHVLGLVANCNAREKSKREALIKRYLEVRKPLVFADDLYFPGCRRNEITVGRAQAALHDTRDRIAAGLFWFIDGNALDKHALRLLMNGNLPGALRVWQRIEAKPVSLGYASSLNNVGSVCCLMTLIGESPGTIEHGPTAGRVEYLHRGIAAKAKLIGGLSGADLSEFCRTFSGDMGSGDPKQVAQIFADSLEDFKAEAKRYGVEVPIQDLVAHLDGGGRRTAAFKARFASPHRQKLERAIRACKAAREQDRGDAVRAGNELMAVARRDLAEVGAVLSVEGYVYARLADEVAEELVDAAVCYFNYRRKADGVSVDVIRSCIALNRYAARIACGAAARSRSRDSLETIERIERDLRTQLDMDSVLTPIEAWLRNGNEVASEVPEERVEFVRQAISTSSSRDSSAVRLMVRIRQRGTEVFGATYSNGEELVRLGSTVCSMCVSLLVSAFNESGQQSVRVAAAELLGMLFVHFAPVSAAGTASTETCFLVEGECFENLRQNWSNSVEFLSRARPLVFKGDRHRRPPATKRARTAPQTPLARGARKAAAVPPAAYGGWRAGWGVVTVAVLVLFGFLLFLARSPGTAPDGGDWDEGGGLDDADTAGQVPNENPVVPTRLDSLLERFKEDRRVRDSLRQFTDSAADTAGSSGFIGTESAGERVPVPAAEDSASIVSDSAATEALQLRSFSLGSSADDVVLIEGEPLEIVTHSRWGTEEWRYESGSVTIEADTRLVVGWSNWARALEVEMIPGQNLTGARFFTVGSSADEVVRLQGTPTELQRFSARGEEVWRYEGGSTVSMTTGARRVTGWANRSEELKVWMASDPEATGPEFISVGSNADDLVRVQGTPTELRVDAERGVEVWRYERNSVTIEADTRRVTEWSNTTGALMVLMIPGASVTSSEFFTVGSSADDVARIHATPTHLRRNTAVGEEVWSYGSNTVTISIDTRRVIRWSNPTGALKARRR